MKVKRRIFCLLAVCLLFALAALVAFADPEEGYTGTVAEAEGRLATLENAESLSDKVNILDGILDYLETVAPGAEGRDTFENALDLSEGEVAYELLSVAESANDTFTLGCAYRELSSFLKRHSISDSVTSASLEQRRLAQKERFESEKSAALADLENMTYVDDYAVLPYLNNDFDASKNGTLTAENNKDSSTVLSYIGEDSGMDGDNSYYTIRFDYVGKHLRATHYLPDVDGSVVFEFDCTTFDCLPDTNVKFEDYSTQNGTTWNIVYLGFNAQGDLVRSNQIIKERVIVPGEWTHISVAVDTETSVVDIYVDYTLVHSFNASHPKLGYAFSPTMMRVGTSVSRAQGSFSMDNVKIYRGHAPRELSRYDSLSEKDKFIFEAGQILNTDISLSGRYAYYESCEKKISNYYLDGKYLTNERNVINAVDDFLSFDKEKAIAVISKDNLEKFASYVDRLKECVPDETNVDARSHWVSECERYLSSVGVLIETSERYHELLAVIDEYRAGIAIENTAEEFMALVSSFYSASTVDKKQELYDSAVSVLPSLNLEYLLSGSFPTFEDSYERSLAMRETLDEAIAINNSKIFLAAIAYVSSYDSEEEWEANFDYIDTYVTIGRKIITSGEYDPYYSGMEEMMPIYERINGYFYEKLQQKHIEHVGAELEKFDNSTVYFERYGIVAMLEQYFSENEIDLENETLSEYRARISEAFVLLESEKGEYDELLKENTLIFIERARKLSGSIGYTEMKMICNELAPYLHMMDVSNSEARDAISVYTARKAEIKRVEEYAEEFLTLSALLSTSENLLESLIEISPYVDRVERDVSGVVNAIESYESLRTRYDEAISAHNREMKSISCVVVYTVNYEGRESFTTLALSEING